MSRVVRSLIILSLLLPATALTWLTTTQGGLLWFYQQASSYLPADFKLQQIKGRLLGPMTLSGIEFQYNGTEIKAEQLIIDWRPAALLGATIDISQLQLQNLSIVLPATDESRQPQSLPQLSLPIRVQLADLLLDNISISKSEQTFNIQQASLKSATIFREIEIEVLEINTASAYLNLSGTLQPDQNYQHQLTTRWHAELPSREVIQGSGQLQGNMDLTHIEQELTGPLQLSLDGQLNDLLQQFNWQARIDIAELNTAHIDREWPALSGKLTLNGKGDLTTAALSGNLNAEHQESGPFDAEFNLQYLADHTIQIDQLTLFSPANQTRVNGHGSWASGDNGDNIQLNLDWKNLRWPLKGQENPWFDSAHGSGRIEGNLDHYRFELTTDRPWSRAPPSSWHANGGGDLKGVNIQQLEVTALDGKATAKGKLAWSPQLSWQAEVNVHNIDPASLLPQWPGQLNATMTTVGSFIDGQLDVDTDISQLTGTLRGYPVSLHSQLGWHNEGIDIGRFDFQSGTSQLHIKGRADETLKLNWHIDTTNLAELYPQAKGQLQASGTLSGARDTPTIVALFNAKSLALMDYHVASLEGSLTMDTGQWQDLNINLSASALKLQGYPLQSLDIRSDKERIEIKAISDDLSAHVEFRGRADPQSWSGEITRATLSSQRFNTWHLKAPAALRVTATNIEAAPLCWLNNHSDICMAFKKEQQRWQANLNTVDLPLMLLAPLLPVDLDLAGAANANAEIIFESAQLKGAADIQILPGTVSYLLHDGEREQWPHHGGTANIFLNEHGINASSTLAMKNDDKLQIVLALPGAQLLTLDPEQQILIAEAKVSITDLGLIEALIPDIKNLKGELAIELAASGAMSQPQINGRAHLLNGTLQIPRLGLSISQLAIKSQSDGLKDLQFKLDARSGTGTLAIEGNSQLDSTAGWPTTFSISGDQFEVAHIPEASVQVSPRLQVNIKNHTIDINGDIHIPYAKLQPRDTTTAVHVSDDAVIVGTEEVTKERWTIYNRTRLTLGERVHFYGFGFEGRLSGTLLLVDEPGQLTKSTGEINIAEGHYRAYGQRLSVEQGKLLYAGGPLMNPGLDLRAVRHVGNITSGLKVRGTLNQPQLELFSVPVMGQTNALAYLLLGRPIESASGEDGAMMAQAVLALGLSGGDRMARSLGERFGIDDMRVESSDSGDQASLVVGRYLSPKLYISYGVGLMDTLNTLAVRYQISDSWQLKGESGESQGADILYTIER